MQHSHDEAVADLWSAQFFNPLTRTDDPTVCTTKDFFEFSVDKHKKPQQVGHAQALAAQNRFFHWHLEFPEVFAAGGFDVVVGNPPWDLVQPEEVKFFGASGAAHIAELQGVKRKCAIEELHDTNPALAAEWHEYRNRIEHYAKFIRGSERFAQTAVGKLNTYSLFAELAPKLVSANGRVGIIVQSGIATDESNKEFFAELIAQRKLVSLFDFVNLEGFFPGIHKTHPHFCALSISGKAVSQPAQLAFYMTRTSQLADARRRFTLDHNDFARLNPNTFTCPVFRTAADAELTKKLYRAAPVLIDERKNVNPWRMQLRQGLFNMTSDSNLFEASPSATNVGLYEAKMIWHFDHRWATCDQGEFRDCTVEESVTLALTLSHDTG